MSEGGGQGNTTLVLFSSEIERNAALLSNALPGGVVAEVAGVGPIESAIGALSAISRINPARVIFLGTAGVYPAAAVSSGAVVAAGEIVLLSGDVASGAMRLPDLVPSRLRCDESLTRALAGGEIPVVKVGCTLGITESDVLAEALGELAEVETMEVFGVASAAARAGVPFAALLGITNSVGKDGGVGWRENFRSMMRRVWERFLGAEEERTTEDTKSTKEHR